MADYYSLKNLKKNKWGVLEENQPMHLCPVMYPGWNAVINNTGKILGRYQKNIICLYRKDHCIIFVDHKEWSALGQFALKKILNNSVWGIKLNSNIIKAADALNDFTNKQIFTSNLSSLSNKQLNDLYVKYLAKQTDLYKYSLIPVYLDLYKPHLTTYIVKYLQDRIELTNNKMLAKECFANLTVPEKLSKIQLEEKSLLEISAQVKIQLKGAKFNQKKISGEVLIKFNQHISLFKYLGYDWEGPPFSDDYFWQRLKENVEDKISPKIKLANLVKDKIKAKKISQRIIKDLKIDIKHQRLLEATKGYIYSKEYRKMSLVQSFYEVESLYKEISKRLNLSVNEVRNCTPKEIEQSLLGQRQLPKDLPKRMKGFLYAVVDKKMPAAVIVGSKYEQMKKFLLKQEDLTEVNYFHGQTACLGKAEGTVRIINKPKDLPKMKEGDIMVSVQTNPELVPAMKKAAAIITNLGGITCHAAIISRELKKPCVIGTKVATKVLRDGDRVFVDANRGDIKRI